MRRRPPPPIVNWNWLVFTLSDWIASLIFKSSSRIGKNVPNSRPLDMIRTSSFERKELRELQTLTKKITQYDTPAEEMRVTLLDRIELNIFARVPPEKAEYIRQTCRQFCEALLSEEGYFTVENRTNNESLSLSQVWDHTKEVRRQLSVFEQGNIQNSIENTLGILLSNMLAEVIAKLPGSEDTSGLGSRVPLYSLYKDPADIIHRLMAIVLRNAEKDDLFSRLIKKFEYNLCVVSGFDPERPDEHNKPFLSPSDYTYKNVSELFASYLGGTPFFNFFTTTVPFVIPHEKRFEHMHVVAGSGHGKTQLLQSFMISDLERVKKGEGSLIVIDSQGDMISKIWKLALLGEMPERVIYIDPTDILHPPALNLFDFGEDRYKNYDPLAQEILINGAIALYDSKPTRF